MRLMIAHSFRFVWHPGHRGASLAYWWPHRQHGLYRGSLAMFSGSRVGIAGVAFMVNER